MKSLLTEVETRCTLPELFPDPSEHTAIAVSSNHFLICGPTPDTEQWSTNQWERLTATALTRRLLTSGSE